MLNKAQKDSLLRHIRSIIDAYKDDTSDSDRISCAGLDVAVIIIHAGIAHQVSQVAQSLVTSMIHEKKPEVTMNHVNFKEDNDGPSLN